MKFCTNAAIRCEYYTNGMCSVPDEIDGDNFCTASLTPHNALDALAIQLVYFTRILKNQQEIADRQLKIEKSLEQLKSEKQR